MTFKMKAKLWDLKQLSLLKVQRVFVQMQGASFDVLNFNGKKDFSQQCFYGLEGEFEALQQQISEMVAAHARK